MRRSGIVAGIVVALGVAACGGNVASPSASAPSGSTAPSGAAVVPSDSGPLESASGSPVAEVSASPSDSPSVSASPIDSASPPSSSPTTSPSPSPTTAPITGCKSTQLKAQVTLWQGAMGSQIASVKITNIGSVKCKVRGTPETQLVGADGTVLIDSKDQGASGLPHLSSSDITWTMGPLGALKTEVQVSNYCGSAVPSLPTTVAFILPSHLGRLVAVAKSGGGVPPCNGNPGDKGSAAMNGWVK